MGIFWENSFTTFLFVTVIIGGGAGYLAGRSLASNWRPVPQLIFYMLLLGLAVRFFHFALFEGTLLSLQYYVVDTLVLIGISLLGYRLTRVSQMVAQYRWLYVRSGPFTWREKQ
ncbi:DUF6867 family protein [Sneathiella sp.]|uniref:DUF6867 family protein n=1 Tax=Sneathiella sp. TaxID=1964365 RepID=UPI0035687B59